MESKFGYQLTQKANADIDDIVSYLAMTLSNPKSASDFVDKLQAAIEEIRMFPASSPQVSNEYMPNLDVRKKLIGSYIMYYLPDYTKKLIFILRIIYGRRNMDEILRQLDT